MGEVIDYDFQGWPIKKMTLREILKYSGLFTFDEEANRYWINDKDPNLDIYPITLEDDGMGYGVNEKFITEVSTCESEKDGKLIKIFINPKADNLDPCAE